MIGRSHIFSLSLCIYIYLCVFTSVSCQRWPTLELSTLYVTTRWRWLTIEETLAPDEIGKAWKRRHKQTKNKRWQWKKDGTRRAGEHIGGLGEPSSPWFRLDEGLKTRSHVPTFWCKFSCHHELSYLYIVFVCCHDNSAHNCITKQSTICQVKR